jgi:hypothetical protein
MECVISDDYAVYSANFYYKNLIDENWLPLKQHIIIKTTVILHQLVLLLCSTTIHLELKH